MNAVKSRVVVLSGALALAGCGGGGGTFGSNLTQQFANLNADPAFAATETPQATLNAMNSTANYDGIVNIGVDTGGGAATTSFYYGTLDLSVNFQNTTTADTVTGSAGNFAEYFSPGATSPYETPVAGSLALSGTLTGVNSGLGDAMTGSAVGSIDGDAVTLDMEGSFLGDAAEAVSLWFNDPGATLSGGVGVGLQ